MGKLQAVLLHNSVLESCYLTTKLLLRKLLFNNRSSLYIKPKKGRSRQITNTLKNGFLSFLLIIESTIIYCVNTISSNSDSKNVEIGIWFILKIQWHTNWLLLLLSSLLRTNLRSPIGGWLREQEFVSLSAVCATQAMRPWSCQSRKKNWGFS